MEATRNNSCWDERSWRIWLIAESARAGIVVQQGRKFPAVPRDRVSELFDAVQERACAPRLPDGTFPAGAYAHDDLDHVTGFLSEALFNALREHKRRRFDRTVADGATVLPFLSDGTADLADVVHTRQALDVIAEQASALADEVKAYMWAESAGVKRAEILAESGWTVRKLRSVRRELDDFRARAQVAIAALLPFPLVHRMLGMRGAGAAAGAGVAGAGTKAVLACGAVAATAACGVGAVVLVEPPERAPETAPVVRTASPSPSPRAAATPAASAPAVPPASRAPRARPPRRREARASASTPARAGATTTSTPPAVAARIGSADPPRLREATSTDFNSEFSP